MHPSKLHFTRSRKAGTQEKKDRRKFCEKLP